MLIRIQFHWIRLIPADNDLFRRRAHWPYFKRLRDEDPVHYAVSEEYGAYWSVTRYEDIMAVETNHDVFFLRANHLSGRPAG